MRKLIILFVLLVSCDTSEEYFENSYSVRFTIDSKIKFCPVKNYIKNDLSKPFLTTNFNIVEIKFEPEKKDILLPILRKLPNPSTRCSKYLIGHAKINRVSYI